MLNAIIPNLRSNLSLAKNRVSGGGNYGISNDLAGQAAAGPDAESLFAPIAHHRIAMSSIIPAGTAGGTPVPAAPGNGICPPDPLKHRSANPSVLTHSADRTTWDFAASGEALLQTFKRTEIELREPAKSRYLRC